MNKSKKEGKLGDGFLREWWAGARRATDMRQSMSRRMLSLKTRLSHRPHSTHAFVPHADVENKLFARKEVMQEYCIMVRVTGCCHNAVKFNLEESSGIEPTNHGALTHPST